MARRAKKPEGRRPLRGLRRSGGRFTISILYPVLYRLEEQGYIEISSTEVADGRARSYYSVTDAGRRYLARTMEE